MIGSLYFWWSIKVFTGLLLILHFALLIFFPQETWLLQALFVFPQKAGQVLVLLGAGISLFHFFYLKKANPRLSQPDALVTSGGLFSLIRHPMYFGDLISYLGFFLLAPSIVAITVLSIAYFAIFRQSSMEDHWLQLQFPSEYAKWQDNSRRLLPFLW